MFITYERKKWDKGIPQYQQSDLMSKEDLYDFALDIVFEFEIKNHDCYKVIDVNPNMNSMPSFVVRANGNLVFILIEAAVAPNMPALSKEREKAFLEHCKKFNAQAFYAPVGFASCDEERFEKGLTLRGDGYYANYIGLIGLNGYPPPLIREH